MTQNLVLILERFLTVSSDFDRRIAKKTQIWFLPLNGHQECHPYDGIYDHLSTNSPAVNVLLLKCNLSDKSTYCRYLE